VFLAASSAIAGSPELADRVMGSKGWWWRQAVNADEAMIVATGVGITVAVIDSGVDLSHPALQGRLRSDGYDFGDCDAGCPMGTDASPQDMLGHGTFVTGLIVARDQKDAGHTGLAPDAAILPIKINPGMMDDFTADALARAIDYAREHRANVINLSMDMPEASSEDRRIVGAALQRALDAGMFVIAAAGNRAGGVTFPACFPGVIAVAGVGETQLFYRGTNLGPEVVIAAPAEHMQSATLGGGFGSRGSGTSFAAPLVSAAIADMLQVDPDLTRARAIEVLKVTARRLTNTGQLQIGTLDAAEALIRLGKH
jgi:subtilisin family serine protease